MSLGVDTFEKDPISFFKLSSDDFSRYGTQIAGLGLPTLFVKEGGYAVEEIGINTVNGLSGFASGQWVSCQEYPASEYPAIVCLTRELSFLQ